ncbi:arabinan endo- -alpha-l-arabinosidase [Moniliophthora roreri MCA 2997]|uniref:arabinan endo-1,5-alpha-L-arabinosidase n=1 Tax=Moniliophthora roreri (strain MCA 2997) TaxID=1381753 RepID=V2WKT4_MONRO|nr:arabinan endo- -alpha-l-arabinosidase [Moniliophthora roreri MCA 2997]
MRPSSFAYGLVLAAVARAQVGPGTVTGDTAVHDPTMCKDKNGKYWVFSTGQGIPIRSSTDRTAFKLEGKVWPNGASWTDQYTGVSNGDLWAPDCYYSGGTFHLFYAASSFGSQNSGIFYAKSTTGLPGSFSNEGLVLSTSGSNNFNAIDPNLLVVGNTWYLSLGSFWTGIKSVTLNPSTGKPNTSTITSLAQRTANGGAIEASNVFKNGNYYYLFTSWDNCCRGTSSTYNIRVGRSSNPNGGFVDKSGVALTSGGGTLVLQTHGNIIGPGGQDLMDDGDGPILIYHYYTPSGSFLGINRLDFSSGWPVVV